MTDTPTTYQEGRRVFILPSPYPATRTLPEDPTAGFLPPNVVPPEGQGRVMFTVRPRGSLVSGAELANRAQIQFDTNPSIDTGIWLNRLDTDPPDSRVSPLSGESLASFEVSWSGTDAGSGVLDYTVYVSRQGGRRRSGSRTPPRPPPLSRARRARPTLSTRCRATGR